MNQALQKSIEHYNTVKSEGDIDLVSEVRQLLCTVGQVKNLTLAYDQHRFIIEAQGKPSDVQRHLLNRYWSHQLMSASRNSTEERYCLIPDGQIGDWLTLFREKVIPFIMENDLPKVV